MISRVLEKMGATVQACGMMYKAMTQSVMLCGIKSWVMMGEMLKVLEGFNHQSDRRITGMTETCVADGEW